ncbi:hypothetical protein [Microbacterium oleivorans]|uniref:Uncharacterized protein n=1 Tax=Microbacterium oleivorans TaxID=273677 RepID=A0A7D5JXE1_9MICO|nr:hypothetical protein [Microbacterium oleivorans]QLD10923.1 hypothetical protein HW566_03450 [Microbacterium oleivorans]
MTLNLNAPDLPAPVPARVGEGVEMRLSHEREVLARVVVVALGGFAVAVTLLCGLGLAVIA